MWNPFKKSQNNQSDNNDLKFNMLQRLAKKLEKMSPQERKSMAKKFLTPENIAKNKPQILAMMEQWTGFYYFCILSLFQPVQ